MKKVLRTPLGWAMAVERQLGGARLLSDPGTVKSVLVLEYMMPLGGLVHMTPVFEAIKADRPEVVVTVATRGLGVEVLRHNPCVDHLVETPNALTDTLATARMLRAELKRRGVKPDCVLTGVSDQRTRIALVSVLLKAGWRGGYTLAPQLYQWALDYLPTGSLLDNNLRLAAMVGCGQGHREPRVYFSDEDLANVRETLAQDGAQEGQFVAVMVTQTSVTQRKGWRAERFRDVAEFLRREYGAHIVFIGAGAEAAAIDALRGGLTFPTTSVAGKTSITQLAAMMSLCNVGLTLDTGPMHVGRAVGLPMVVIAPAWSPPLEWLPIDDDRFRVLKNGDIPVAPADYIIDEVSVDEVQSGLQDLIQRYPRNGSWV
jgi:ADP-heptose:LPS heptosyltransferase